MVCVREYRGRKVESYGRESVVTFLPGSSFEALALALGVKSGKFESKGVLIPSSSLGSCAVIIEQFFLFYISI